MSDTKKDNIAELFKVEKKEKITSYYIYNEDIDKALMNNIPQVINDWFKFQSMWTYNAYASLKDMDKYLILMYLIQKTFTHYSDTFLILSENTFYNMDNFEIEKINLIEISEELKITKETVRRKINELNKNGVIERIGKRIVLNTEAFQKQRPVTTIKQLSVFLSKMSDIINNETKVLSKQVDSKTLENFIRENFSLVWRFFLRTQIPNLVSWRSFYGDLETYNVTGTVIVNQMHKLRSKYKGKGILIDNDKLSNDDKFKKIYEYAFSRGDEIVGINASSISEITGIPRATVIRKLRQSTKFGLIQKDKNQLYITKKLKKTKLNSFFDTGREVQSRVYNFIATFFSLYVSKERIPKSK